MKDQITFGQKYDPAMSITDQADADAYFEECVQHTMRVSGKFREEAERTERHNLGYWAGYYSHEVRERVERLFRCAHPIFGSIAKNGPPSVQECFEAGVKLGKSIREGKP